ncbi:hypothetical protein ACFL3S_01115 [Gemmatimonadota bacterium]
MRELSLQELVGFRFHKAMGYPEVLGARFERGERCYGFLNEGSLAHVAWLSFGYLVLDTGLPVIQDEAAAGLFDGFTMPEHRGRGIFKAVFPKLCEVAWELGWRDVLAAIDPTHQISIRTAERSGFLLEGRATAVRRFGRTRLSVQPLEPQPGA